MKREKLISMKDFVLEQMKNYNSTCVEEGTDQVDNIILNRIDLYANFLSQPLTLGMFVPCDEDGNALKMPIDNSVLFSTPDNNQGFIDDLENDFLDKLVTFRNAEERVLFEGLFTQFLEDLKDGTTILKPIDTIESFVKHSLTITPTALKQIGL